MLDAAYISNRFNIVPFCQSTEILSISLPVDNRYAIPSWVKPKFNLQNLPRAYRGILRSGLEPTQTIRRSTDVS